MVAVVFPFLQASYSYVSILKHVLIINHTNFIFILFVLFFQDTAGEEKFSGLSSFYCRGASAAIIAYDITQGRSLQALKERHLHLLEAAEPRCLVVVVGTKADLVTNNTREIPWTAGEKLALEQNEKKERPRNSFEVHPFFETSAKTGKDVEKVFDFILNTCLPLHDEETARRSIRKTSGVDLEQKSSNSQKEHRTKCC